MKVRNNPIRASVVESFLNEYAGEFFRLESLDGARLAAGWLRIVYGEFEEGRDGFDPTRAEADGSDMQPVRCQVFYIVDQGDPRPCNAICFSALDVFCVSDGTIVFDKIWNEVD